MRLLIVEDNNDLAELLSARLESAGFAADRAATAGDARILTETRAYAAIILDLGLPDDDGLTVLRDLRGRLNATPVLILTARSGVNDRVNGLNAGGDDYLVKPFSHEELIARIQALLRRPGALLGLSLKVGNVVFDSDTRETVIGGRPQRLSSRECEILELLMRRIGRVVSKQHLEDQLFGTDDLGSNAVEVYVHRLRRRFEKNGARAEIHTVRGIGYMLAEITP